MPGPGSPRSRTKTEPRGPPENRINNPSIPEPSRPPRPDPQSHSQPATKRGHRTPTRKVRPRQRKEGPRVSPAKTKGPTTCPSTAPGHHQRPSTHPPPPKKYYTHPKIKTTFRRYSILDTQAGLTYPQLATSPVPSHHYPRPTSAPRAPSPGPGTRAKSGPEPGNCTPGPKPPGPPGPQLRGGMIPEPQAPHAHPEPTPAQLDHRIGNP
ncbi:proline-rich protein 2-like [Austrofundulus limnaeus]|uniref:Proline-rich protein 2-like n=1 Tax=Austrofundulus limnaeus TaxID=52670 RepID=A0A2I4BAW8_AUSLI|nr:PREDICTED: proline-rich protein 2-like [Austrofundulus limnaeus]